MRFAIDIEDVPEELEAIDYDEAIEKVRDLISIQEVQEWYTN